MFNDVPSDDFIEIENPEHSQSEIQLDPPLNTDEDKDKNPYNLPNFFIVEDMQPLYYFNVKPSKDEEDLLSIV